MNGADQKRNRKRLSAWSEVIQAFGLNAAPHLIPKDVVYNDLPHEFVDTTIEPEDDIRLFATNILKRALRRNIIKGSKFQDKVQFGGQLFVSLQRAVYSGGCVVIQRNKGHSDYSSLKIQVIDAFSKTGFVHEFRSRKGSPRSSRLIPTNEFKKLTLTDPWDFDRDNSGFFVILRSRETKEELPVERENYVFADAQDKLASINKTNDQHKITYTPRVFWAKRSFPDRQIRPVHYAIFTDSSELHGRLYTRRYGHQSLTQKERSTIKIDGQQTVELDYSGLHPRLLYHRAGVDFNGDPYLLWGADTTPGQRKLAKKIVNIAINAKTRQSALRAIKAEMRLVKTKDGNMTVKNNREYAEARELSAAFESTGMSLEEIYDLAQQMNSPIADQFGSDAGMRLMRIDSSIALDVMFHFAEKSVPCLGVHDSFIVPENLRDELSDVMHKIYFSKVGFHPQVK